MRNADVIVLLQGRIVLSHFACCVDESDLVEVLSNT